MMFSKISLVTSLLFFLFGPNIFAHSQLEDSAPFNGTDYTESLHNMTAFAVITVSNNKVNTEASATETSNHLKENTGVVSKKTESVDPSFKDYVLPVSVGLVFIIVFGSYWFIYRRKHI